MFGNFIHFFQPKFEAQFWPETEENYEDLPSNRGKRNPQFSRNNFKTPFNLQEILDNNFNSETWNGTWVSDTQYVYRLVECFEYLLTMQMIFSMS